MFDAVIFDMDGVLVDSEPLHEATTAEVLAPFGVRLDHADYAACMGMTEEAFFALLVERFGLPDPPAVLARRRLARSLERMAREALPPMPGAVECLLGLAGQGPALALASAASRAQVELVVERLGLQRLLAVRVSGEDVARGKPAPDLFLEAARRLDVEPARCLVVEDAVLGVQAARAAGMCALALPAPGDDGARHLAAGARRVLDSLAQLDAELLEALAAEPETP